ncbi:hypothetical protein CBM2629_A160101 [Cupriavidus taiwanensis]|nr:hypothetical protein CBM2629_A160101 [Cupriavidus taiwanensis]
MPAGRRACRGGRFLLPSAFSPYAKSPFRQSHYIPAACGTGQGTECHTPCGIIDCQVKHCRNA